MYPQAQVSVSKRTHKTALSIPTGLKRQHVDRRPCSAFENTHLLPPLPQRADANGRAVRRAANVLHVEQLILAAECEEVREKRVEVGLRAQVQDLRIVGVVYVREYAQ